MLLETARITNTGSSHRRLPVFFAIALKKSVSSSAVKNRRRPGKKA
jgi:hypothetical protein